MIIVKRYTNDFHTRRLVVRRAGSLGWDVRVEADERVVEHAQYAEWHRVERAQQRFELAVSADGWREVTAPAH